MVYLNFCLCIEDVVYTVFCALVRGYHVHCFGPWVEVIMYTVFCALAIISDETLQPIKIIWIPSISVIYQQLLTL
jgi:hypothetical protein